MGVKDFLFYITNNEETSRHEEYFDIAFFIINTAVVLIGGWYLIHEGESHWLPFLIIEYTWAIDTMRHNRPKGGL
ncbi:MAG: hypothetical protein JO019_02250 [Candidatus Kaiserbacteria bacterium]|nr:hypothetical protein [Candidatus Kaiserbacteria bacterium]